MNIVKRFLWTVVAALTLLALYGCNDKSTEPEPEPEPEPLPQYSEYPVYFIDRYHADTLFEYYPGTEYLTATELDMSDVRSMAVSYGGDRLFVYTSDDGLKVVDLATKAIETVLPYMGHPAISPDGALLVLAGDSIRILDAHSLDLLHTIDTIAAASSWFSVDGARLYLPVRHGYRDNAHRGGGDGSTRLSGRDAGAVEGDTEPKWNS